MNDLLEALIAHGWRHGNHKRMCDVESEIVHWPLEDTQSSLIVLLDFHMFGELGNPSESLSDILYCVIRGTGVKLYFAKRKSDKWQQALADFIAAIDKCRQKS